MLSAVGHLLALSNNEVPTLAPDRVTAAIGRALDVSPAAYRLLVAAIVALYLFLWLTHFQYVYGLVMDDYYSFSKALATVQDWRASFAQPSIEQAYFFMISYLPLWSGISLPSYPLYSIGAQTGQFRVLMLWVLCLHAVVLILWAWFLRILDVNRLAALCAVLLLASSPSFLFWSPKPDSRLLGLPFVFVGLALLLRPLPGHAGRGGGEAWCAYAAGTSLWVAQSIHYTALYLIVPAVLIVWTSRGWRGLRQPWYWLALGAFAVGCVWLQGLIELVDHLALGLPWDQGPTATLFALRTQHHSLWSVEENLVVWFELFRSQMGLVLLALIGVGWLLLVWRDEEVARSAPPARRLIGLSAPLGLLYLLVAGTAPFFRQTAVLQPFLFLFAGIGAVAVLERLARRRRVIGWLGLAVVFVSSGVVQWQQAAATMQAQLGLGQALEWAYAHKGERPLVWLPPHDFAAPQDLTTVDALAALPSDAWLLAYFPWGFLGGHPGLRPYLDVAPPLGAWPSLYATESLWAEARGFGHPDLRRDRLLRDVRVLDASHIVALARGQPLAIRSVTADSTAQGAGPERAFDLGASPDQVTTWVSGDSLATHFLAIEFGAPISLAAVEIMLPPSQRSVTRIATLDVEVAGDDAEYHTVWRGDYLEQYPSLMSTWPPEVVSRVRLVLRRQVTPRGESRQAFVEEIVFPGYHVLLPSAEVPWLRDEMAPGPPGALD